MRSGALGETTLSEAVYQPILQAMADHQVRTVRQIQAAVAAAGVSYAQLTQAVLVLAGLGHLLLVQAEELVSAARPRAEQLNRHLMMKSRSKGDIQFLVSPLTGSGISVPCFEQLFLLAIAEGASAPAGWAATAWAVLSQQGQRIIKDGVTLKKTKGHSLCLRTSVILFP
jgi:hypothetical protein